MISVIVPVRDDPRVDALLTSLAAQEGGPDFEVIVVRDGGSRVPQLPAGLRANVLALPPRGPYAARNEGAKEAGGDVLLFTDSDCECPPGWVGAAADAFRDPSLEALQGGSRAGSGSRLSRWIQLEYERYVESHAPTSYRRFCNTRNFGIRREIFLRDEFPDAQLRGGDGMYGRTLEAKGVSIRYDPRWVVVHRHPRSRITFARQVFRQGLDGARWDLSGAANLFEDGPAAAPKGPGRWLLELAAGSPAASRAASAALAGLAGILSAATVVLPYEAGRPVFHRFARAAHLSGRLRGEAERVK